MGEKSTLSIFFGDTSLMLKKIFQKLMSKKVNPPIQDAPKNTDKLIKQIETNTIKDVLNFDQQKEIKTSISNNFGIVSDSGNYNSMYAQEVADIYKKYESMGELSEDDCLEFYESLYEAKFKHGLIKPDDSIKTLSTRKKNNVDEQLESFVSPHALNFSTNFIDFVKKSNTNDGEYITFFRNPNPDHYVQMNDLAKRIECATKFIIPKSGIFMKLQIDERMGFQSFSPYIKHFKLPFEKIVFEFPHQEIGKDGIVTNINYLVLCEQVSDDVIKANIFYKYSHGPWVKLIKDEITLKKFKRPYFKKEEINISALSTSDVRFLESFVIKSSEVVIRLIYDFLAVTNCSNTVIEEAIKAGKHINKSRAKKGKAPLFDYKILALDFASKGLANGQGENRENFKRSHLRRGHIRKLKDKTIWVNGCLVNGKKKGYVQKDYFVKC